MIRERGEVQSRPVADIQIAYASSRSRRGGPPGIAVGRYESCDTVTGSANTRDIEGMTRQS